MFDWNCFLKEMQKCEKCPRLVSSRTQIVVPDPQRNAATVQVMIIGESPGQQEDKEGTPFCGRSFLGLSKFILAVGLEHGDFYVTNAVKCFAKNWDKNKNEIKKCRENWLIKEIVRFRPQFIFPLGKIALESVVGHSLKTNYSTLLEKNPDHLWYEMVNFHHGEVSLNWRLRLHFEEKHNYDFKKISSVPEFRDMYREFYLFPFYHPSPINRYWPKDLSTNPLIKYYRETMKSFKHFMNAI